MFEILGALLVMMGWRAWGHGKLFGIGSRAWGTFIGATGLWLQYDYPAWAWQALAAGFFLLRLKSPHKWWNTWQANKWGAAFGRTLWAIPLVLVQVYLQDSVAPLLHGAMAIAALPAAYWAGHQITVWFNARYSSKGYQAETVATGEIFAGLVVGAIGI